MEGDGGKLKCDCRTIGEAKGECVWGGIGRWSHRLTVPTCSTLIPGTSFGARKAASVSSKKRTSMLLAFASLFFSSNLPRRDNQSKKASRAGMRDCARAEDRESERADNRPEGGERPCSCRELLPSSTNG